MSQAVEVGGRYSKYTLMIITYESRLRLAQLAVRRYSRCPSVGEVVIVWNAGKVRRSVGGQPYGAFWSAACIQLAQQHAAGLCTVSSLLGGRGQADIGTGAALLCTLSHGALEALGTA